MGMIKACRLIYSSNLAKINKVVELIQEYRSLSAPVAAQKWNIFQKQGLFDKNRIIKHICFTSQRTPLVGLSVSGVGMLDSFLADISILWCN